MKIFLLGLRLRTRLAAQRVLDRAESFASRRRWVGLTFAILQLKRRLGLRYER